jgi:hypothetical protein
MQAAANLISPHESALSIPCTKIRVKCDGVAPTACWRCVDKHQPCEYREVRDRRDNNGAPQRNSHRGVSSPRRSSGTPSRGLADGLEMCQPSYSVEPPNETMTTMRLAGKHLNSGVPLTSK